MTFVGRVQLNKNMGLFEGIKKSRSKQFAFSVISVVIEVKNLTNLYIKLHFLFLKEKKQLWRLVEKSVLQHSLGFEISGEGDKVRWALSLITCL